MRVKIDPGEPVEVRVPDIPQVQPDEYVKCPYFPEHELRRNRLPYHLMKCQSNPNAPKLFVCPFNYLHRVSFEERQQHLIVCEDGRNVKYKNREQSFANTRKTVFGLSSGAASSTKSESGQPTSTNSEENW